jgi:N-methylhydantoinase B/oxoprolinase/acetone carboxylase alpha subunit
MTDRDGVFGIPNAGGNVTNQPVEMIEAQFPIRIERYGMVPNSGGPGRHRGAPAYVRTYRMLAEETVVVMRSDRRNHLPYGLDGGAPGTPSWNLLNPGPAQQAVPVMPMEPLVMRRDEVLCHIGAGGGGYGDPFERDPGLPPRCGSRAVRLSMFARSTALFLIHRPGTSTASRPMSHVNPSAARAKKTAIHRPTYLPSF